LGVCKARSETKPAEFPPDKGRPKEGARMTFHTDESKLKKELSSWSSGHPDGKKAAEKTEKILRESNSREAIVLSVDPENHSVECKCVDSGREFTAPLSAQKGQQKVHVSECYFGESLQNPKWKTDFQPVNTSQALLVSNTILIRVLAGQENGKDVMMGSWEEEVSNLLDQIDSNNSRLKFKAEFTTPKGAELAFMDVDMDMWWHAPHKDYTKAMRGDFTAKTATEKKFSNEAVPLPIMRGIQALAGEGQAAQREVTYTCTCYLDCLPTHLESMQPYVKIRMGYMGKWGQTLPADDGRYYDVTFNNQAKVRTKSYNRRADIQIWNKTKTMFGQDELLGEVTIYDVTPGRVAWCHFYGGAFGGLHSQDVAMMRGAISPASTCHGSAAILFDTKPRPAQNFDKDARSHRIEKRLVVRLYRGCYLPKEVRNMEVNVLVELAGCYLPVPDKGGDKRRAKNRSLLSFPATVDKHGGMQFLIDGHESFLSLLKYNSSGERKAWVQRSTPKDLIEPEDQGEKEEKDEKGQKISREEKEQAEAELHMLLKVPPNVKHAYLYIVPVGQEDEPAQLFTRLRLQNETCKAYQKQKGDYKKSATTFQKEERGKSRPLPAVEAKEQKEYVKNINDVLGSPYWKRIRKDQSVVGPSQGHGDDFAGFLLGSAVLIDPVFSAADKAKASTATTTTTQGSKAPEAVSLADEVLLKEIGAQAQKPGEAKVDVPQMTGPMSVMCKPFTGRDKYRRKGCAGEPTEIIYRNEGNKKTVYAHIDVLAARDLQELDEDNVCKAVYQMKVQNNLVNQPADFMPTNTSNPNYYCRHVVPIEEIEDYMTMDKERKEKDGQDVLKARPHSDIAYKNFVPPPPIILYMRDLDNVSPVDGGDLIEKAQGITQKAEGVDEPEEKGRLGIIAIKKPQIFPTAEGEAFDANNNRIAEWHALGQPARTEWDTAHAGMKPSWKGRARVLVACSYSLSQTVKTPPPEVKGSETSKFDWIFTANDKDEEIKWNHLDITLDLLGLRNLTDENPINKIKIPRMGHRTLLIKGFDDHPYRLTIDAETNVNFTADQTDKSIPLTKVNEELKGVLRIKGFNDQDESGAVPEDSNSKDSDEVQSVDIQDFFGARMRKDVYPVPILEYSENWRKKVQKEVEKMDPPLKYPAWKRYLTVTDKQQRRIRQFDANFAEVLGDDRFPLKVEKRANLNKLVLMPELVFEVRNAGGLLHGNCALQLPPPPPLEEPDKPDKIHEPFHEHWWDTCVKEKKELKAEEWAAFNLQVLKDVDSLEDAYDVFVDVFAASKGYLLWDNDLHLGRAIREQKLFSISPEDPKAKAGEKTQKDAKADVDQEGPFTQFFNPADWMLGAPRFLDEPFDNRVTPVLRCAQWDKDKKGWICYEEDKDGNPRSFSIDEIKKGNKNRPSIPLGRKTLFQGYIKENYWTSAKAVERRMEEEIDNQDGTAEAKPVTTFTELERATTQDLKIALQKRNCRCVSHLHVPEYVENYTEPKESKDYNKDLCKNLHCFVRSVGHQILAEDRDSRFLCKLRLCPPDSVLPESMYNDKAEKGGKRSVRTEAASVAAGETPGTPGEKAGERKSESEKKSEAQIMVKELVEQNSNFLLIKYHKPGIVIWAPPDHITEWAEPGKVLFVVQHFDGQRVRVCVPNFDLRYPRETAYYPLKTFSQRWRTLELEIAKNKKGLESQAEGMRKKAGKESYCKAAAKMQTAKLARGSSKKKSPEDLQFQDEDGDGEDEDHTRDREDSDDEKDKGDPDSVDAEKAPPDGRSNAVWVHKDAFVVRLKKRAGCVCYDRMQTQNWYRVVLEQVFPEVKRLKTLDQGDKEHTKNMFFDRCLNVRLPLLSADLGDCGMIKGHLRVSRTKPEDIKKKLEENVQKAVEEGKTDSGPFKKVVSFLKGEKQSGSPDLSKLLNATDLGLENMSKLASGFFELRDAKEPEMYRPVDDFWLSTEVSANVYVLTANELKVPRLPWGALSDKVHVKLTLEIVGSGHPVEKNHVVNKQDLKGQTVGFYDHFPLSASVPGPSTLRIKLWAMPPVSPEINAGVFGKIELAKGTLIGTADVDLEDRWFTLTKRFHRSACNRDYMKDNVSPFGKRPDGKEGPFRFKSVTRKEFNSSQSTDTTTPSSLFASGDSKAPKKRFIEPKEVELRHQTYHPVKDEGRGVGPVGLATPQSKAEAEGVKEFEIKPNVCSPDPLPVEILDLEREDEDTATTTKVGVLRLWVDLNDEMADYNVPHLKLNGVPFEVRVTVKKITKITVFKDYGERNDVFVEGKFTVMDWAGNPKESRQVTDVHKWATSEASFNWRWKFVADAPATQCSIKLSIFDEDIMERDPIYFAKEIALDHMLMLAYRNYNAQKPALGVHSMKIRFDDWAHREAQYIYSCCCFCKRKKPNKEGACFMDIDVEIIPKVDADTEPVPDGEVAAPTGRISWDTAIKEPWTFFKLVLGPYNTQTFIWCCCGTWCCVFLVVILACVFFFNKGVIETIGEFMPD